MSPLEKDDSALAAEYVLRLLSPEEERAFEARLASDRALEAEVAQWVNRFAGLDDEVTEVAPGSRVKAGLQSRLFGEETPRALPIWQRLGLWQGLSFASVAVAAFFAMQSLTPPVVPERAPIYVSEIAAADQSLRLLAVYNSATDQVRITRTAGQALEGRVLELWAIAGQNAPVSLGVLPADLKAAVVLPAVFREGVGGLVLAISDEPPGGSPTGAPTGAVLAVGQVTEL